MLDRAPLSRPASVKVALITFLVLSAISVAVIFVLPKTYLAITRVDLVKKNSVPPTGTYDPYYILTEFDLIKSDAVLVKVVTELRRSGLLNESDRSGQAIDVEVETRELLKKLYLRQYRSTTIIEIRYFHSDPKSAAKIANTIARVYAAQDKTPSGPERIEVIDLAQPPTRPISPNVPKLLAIATILNSLLAVFAGFFASNLFR